MITRDIYLQSPNVHWDDIAGLDEVSSIQLVLRELSSSKGKEIVERSSCDARKVP